jgi:hypothetical protein
MRLRSFGIAFLIYSSIAVAQEASSPALLDALTELERVAEQVTKVDHPCPQVYPTATGALFDETGTGAKAEYKYEFYPPKSLLISHLLAKDHPTKCGREVVVLAAEIDMDRGIYTSITLDVGMYDGCPGSTQSKKFGYDHAAKKRFGNEFRTFWEERGVYMLGEMKRMMTLCLK